MELIFEYTSQADNVRLLVESTMRQIFVLLKQPELSAFISKFAQDSNEVNNKACMALTYSHDSLPEYGEHLLITFIDDTGEIDMERALKIEEEEGLHDRDAYKRLREIDQVIRAFGKQKLQTISLMQKKFQPESSDTFRYALKAQE